MEIAERTCVSAYRGPALYIKYWTSAIMIIQLVSSVLNEAMTNVTIHHMYILNPVI